MNNSKLNKTMKANTLNEGQFSWMTQDTGNQIGSQKQNTIAVTMFDDKGNKWLERRYDGYGEFGGKDYYELLAQMNGVENADRQDGIDIAFGKMKIKGDVLFPALIEEPNRFNSKRHDFTQEPENDPNQSWYQEEEDEDDDDYDEYDESVVTESHFKVGDKVKMSHGGEGVIKSLDKKDGGDDEKYYSVELSTGEIHKHSSNELELIESIQERHIMVKRKYTENHPAIKVGKTAKIRNTVIEAVKNGKLTRAEFDTILREMTVDSTRWIRRNASYFNVNEDGITLSKVGRKILNNLSKSAVVNEKVTPYKLANVKAEEIFGEFGVATLSYDQLSRIIDIKMADKLAKNYGEASFMALTELDMEELLNTNKNLIKENNMKTNFIHESFKGFVNSLNELNINESFKSSMLANLFTRDGGKFDQALAKGFYNATKIKLDLVEDEDLITIDANTAYKNKQSDTIVFYISDTPKENPYAPSDAYGSNKNIPGEGYLLAVASGDNKFYDNAWSRYAKDRSFKKVDNNPSDSIGIGKRYSGWDATGLYNVKRISEVADRAVVINVTLLKQKYSSENQRAERLAARSGATAFKSDKDFKTENMNRYHTILAQKAASMPIDSLVSDAIETISNQIKDALLKGEKGKYGDIIIGTSSRGKECKLSDAAYHMKNILDDYQRYVGYIQQEEDSVTRYGQAESYYKREMQNYAKSIKDRADQIESMSYAW